MWLTKTVEDSRQRGEFDFFEEYDHQAIGGFLDYNDRRLRGFFKGGIFERGAEYLDALKDEQVMYYANHQSMVDNFLIVKLFHDHLEESFPRIIAGDSLDSSYLQKAFNFEFSKAGVCWIDRARIAAGDERYRKRWGLAVGREMKTGKSYMIFPEGTRSLYRNGDLGDRKDLGFEGLISASKRDPYIVTVAFNYDHPVEALFAPLINWGRQEHKFFPKGFSDVVYKGADWLSFKTRRFVPWRGDARIVISEPKKLTDIIGRHSGDTASRGLREYARQQILADYQTMEANKGHYGFNRI